MRSELFRQIFRSLALLCVPLAFQLAAAAPASLPDDLWLMLVVSVWSGLVIGAMAAVLCLRALQVGLRTWRARGRPGWELRRYGARRSAV